MATLLLVGLLACPTFGVINIKLTSDEPWLYYGKSTTIRLWAQGTAAGILSMAGDIAASGPGLTANAGSFMWAPEFRPSGLFIPKPGTATPNGGWTGFGSQQTNWEIFDANYGKADYVQLASYSVTNAPLPYDSVTLTFVPKTVSGYKPLETDKTGIIGLNQSLTLPLGVPEPVTLALLALGSLMLARRRT
jgi:hypothetical protein